MTVAVKKTSIKAQMIGTVIALISAVALPQIVHVIGAVSGMGTLLGEALLPMHLPIILAGLLGGSYVAGIAGLLKDVKIPTIVVVLIAQIAGRAVRGIAIVIGFYALNTAIAPTAIFTRILTGLFGILLQLIIIPLAVYRLKEADNE